MVQFSEASKNHLAVAVTVMTEVESALAAMKDHTTPFNVAAYAKQIAAANNVDDLFVAHLIRSVVNNSDTYESRRGRGGGVIPKGSAPVKVPKAPKVAPATAENAPTTERVPNTEAAPQDVDTAPVTERTPSTEEPVTELPAEIQMVSVAEPGVPVVLDDDSDAPVVAQSPENDTWFENLMAEG